MSFENLGSGLMRRLGWKQGKHFKEFKF